MKVWAKMVADFVYSCYTLPFFSSRDVLDNQMIEYIRQYMVMMMMFLCFFVLDDDYSPGMFCNTTLLPSTLAWI